MTRTLLLAVVLAGCSVSVSAQGAAPLGGGSVQGASLGLEGVVRRLGPGEVWLLPQQGAPVRQPTIQAAVDAALEGDTIELGNGVFTGRGNRDVLVTGKNVTIRSRNGPSRCIIDCEGRGRALRLEGTSVSPNTVIQGLTIVNGDGGTVGGGIYCASGSSPTIESCILSFCESRSGGGVFSDLGGSPFIRETSFLGNEAAGGFGGGASLFSAVVERCSFVGNTATGGGAGMRGIVSGIVRDSLFVDNASVGLGGGLMLEASFRADNCTFVGNVALLGGAVGFGAETSSVAANSILWGNAGCIGKEAYFSSAAASISDGTIEYCLIEGGESGVAGMTGAMYELVSILDADPLFLDPGTGDYRLAPTSPCIEAGDPSFTAPSNVGDLENQPRIAGGRVDMGADEYWEGVALGLAWPGRAGEENTIAVAGAPSGSLVHFFAGTAAGTYPIPFGACPSLALDMADPLLLSVSPASFQGLASHTQFVQPSIGGQRILTQAVSFDPTDPSAGCGVSNLVEYVYQ